MHERVESADATLGINQDSTKVVGDHVFRVEAVSRGDFATGFEANLVGHVSPGLGAVSGQPPPRVIRTHTDGFGESFEHGGGIDLRPDGDGYQMDIRTAGKGIPNFEHLGGDASAAVGATGVGVSEDDSFAFEVGKVFIGSGAVEGDEGFPELAEDGQGGFSIEFEAVEGGFEQVTAATESQKEGGNEKPELDRRAVWLGLG